ncbi:anamorsin isoform X7 [Cetorhinus maximus]
MDRFDIMSGHNVAVLWDNSSTAESGMQLVQDIRAVTGEFGYVAMENIGRLTICDSSKLKTGSQLTSALKLAGFTEITEIQTEPLTAEQLCSIKQSVGHQGNNLIKMALMAKKPNFEVGSSAQLKLSFVKKPKAVEKPQLDLNTRKAWTLSATDMNDDDVDLIDSDELLDEADLKKPDPASLRAMDCGDSKKKKRACKNCLYFSTCGLADELGGKGSKGAKIPQVKSSCGSCYLGDAFRCASCPYMGMPAFKPGEKILLSDQTLTDA